MIQKLQAYIQDALQSFHLIPEQRKKVLQKISGFIQKKQNEERIAQLIYVCTHNSRRSHFGQVWGKTAAVYYNIKNINTYSAGTEATTFNINAIKALERAGFIITKNSDSVNPFYSVAYSKEDEAITCFSKTHNEGTIPQKELCAIMTCTDADGNCPFIEGTELRVSCPYDDPKVFDNTPFQDEKYNERCRQIAIENLYIFSLIK